MTRLCSEIWLYILHLKAALPIHPFLAFYCSIFTYITTQLFPFTGKIRLLEVQYQFIWRKQAIELIYFSPSTIGNNIIGWYQLFRIRLHASSVKIDMCRIGLNSLISPQYCYQDSSPQAVGLNQTRGDLNLSNFMVNIFT